MRQLLQNKGQLLYYFLLIARTDYYRSSWRKQMNGLILHPAD